MAHVHEHEHENLIPKGAVAALGGLVIAVVAAVALFRITGGDPVQIRHAAPLELARDLHFHDLPGGRVAVHDAQSGKPVAYLEPGQDGFVRVTLRNLARERLRAGHSPDVPFRVARWADGRTTVEDPATGRLISLNAFGAPNAQSFARLLDAKTTP